MGHKRLAWSSLETFNLSRWRLPVDDQTFLQRLQNAPDNSELRQEYFAWLEANADPRLEYVRLALERQELQDKLAEIDQRAYVASGNIDRIWLDIVFPLHVRSQTVGKWYPRPMPHLAPFIAVGDFVGNNTVIGLIEVLKTYNEVAANLNGIVAEICVEEGQLVEFNQVLVKVNRYPEFIAGG
jgi:biotin carboxyl carrier protein